MSGTYISYPAATTGSVSATTIAFGVGALDGQAALANGMSVNSTSLFMQSATASFPGLVSSASQTFGGVKTFSSAPNLSSLTASAFLKLDGSKNITVGSISLTGDVTGNLPLSQTQGSLSLTTQVVGILPALNLPPLSGITGSVSLTSQVSGNLPLSQTQGSLSLTTQVVGILPAANHPPLSSLTGSVSLTAQVSGILPQANMTGVVGTNTGDISLAAFGSTPSSTGGSIGAGQVLTLQPASVGQPGGVSTAAQSFGGTKTFTTITVGSVSFNNSSAGGSAHSYVLPGAQGAANTAFTNDGNGLLSWVSILTNPFTTSGDIIVSSGTSTVQRLGIGANSGGRVLTVSSGSLIPSWQLTTVPTLQTFITVGSNSYFTPAGCRRIKVTAVGGGGGGGGTASTAAAAGAGGGGGGGGTSIKWLSPTPQQVYALIVGNAGVGGTAGNNAGVTGSASTFGGTVIGNGGVGGNGHAGNATTPGYYSAGGAGGTATGGDVNVSGGTGDFSIVFSGVSAASGTGGGTFYASPTPRVGGTSGGTNGSSTGGGGAGGSEVNNGGAQAGGNGAVGSIFIEEYY